MKKKKKSKHKNKPDKTKNLSQLFALGAYQLFVSIPAFNVSIQESKYERKRHIPM